MRMSNRLNVFPFHKNGMEIHNNLVITKKNAYEKIYN